MTMTDKKTLPGADASMLAVLAQCGGSFPKDQEAEMMSMLSCDTSRKIAKNIIAGNRKNKDAKAFIEWAESLRSAKKAPTKLTEKQKSAKKQLRSVKQKLWAVVRFIDFEGPYAITLYFSKAAADKACPKFAGYDVIGPLTVGVEASLYG